jgi:membrane protease subunit HflC
MMANRGLLTLIAAVVVALLISMATFTVRETELAIKFRFGQIVNSDYAPGLHFMLPMVNNIRKFERRIITRNYPSEQFLTSEGKILRIDFYIKWRISDVSTFYQATSGGDEEIAALRLGSIVKDGIKGVIARRTIQQVVAAERAEFTGEILKIAQASASGLGLQLVDVRVKKIDLPEEVSESVFSRMRQDFDRQAKRLRAEGAENAEKLRAEADRERIEILANAYREAEGIRGEGDAKAAEVYAAAYSRNAEFYSFYRSLQAYRESLGTDSDVLVISPEGEFFKYLKRAKQR